MTLRIIIIAGPNGVGKTTFARAFLPQEAHCQRFINADLLPPDCHRLRLKSWLLKRGD